VRHLIKPINNPSPKVVRSTFMSIKYKRSTFANCLEKTETFC
jgi:hypothetical protein